VLDADGLFAERYCNLEMVELMPIVEEADIAELRRLIERHYYYTGSPVARWVLEDWPGVLRRFVKVFPIDYRKALERLAQEQEEELVRQQLAA
jgi:glutamate synthase domain-containing protein 3